MRFLLVCGGTAGHINPALAVAGRLKEMLPDSEFLFVGAGREMEKRLIPAEGYELKNVTISGFSRSASVSGLKKNLEVVRELGESRRQAGAIIKEFRPDIVIGTGGYVCYPVITAAVKLGIPTCLHESNAVPGLTAKILSGVVDKLLTAFPGTEKNYKKPERVVFTGTPVRGGFGKVTREDARSALGLKDEKLVVSFWGSLGAEKMNGFMTDFIAENGARRAFFHIHSTGGGQEGLDKMKAALENYGGVPENCDLRAYILNMDMVMTAADVVMSRSGASTIAELAYLGTPSILVPSPNVTNDHQTKNAKAMELAGGAILIPETECSGERLFDEAARLVSDERKLAEMRKGALSLSGGDSSGKMAEVILSLINRS
ncbi:MAG: UDP-N-acetylglucosamine--N-acetylmuramyl-(pentapeptide) pyrophosphoryl-undecaprenol N-acetylglucosamine transferase [Oscillospiraceae bacterium]|nr:UDP-N-acetylglucosamine--N-acetylmuramyl-(pentapeptide) pyrophosphoryl-undecaprenol N-acetylglucosamine transferase [Oscillospiraceae bacterium]